MIEIENLRKSSGPPEGRKGINLTVAKGEVLDTLRVLAFEGMTTIDLINEMNFDIEVSDIIIFLHTVVTAEVAPPDQLFDTPREPELQKFLAATH